MGESYRVEANLADVALNRHLESFLSVGLVASLVTLGSAFIIGMAGLMVLPIMLIKAWVLTHLWSWFVMPMFDLPQLTLVHAMGFVLLVNFLRSSNSYKDWKKGRENKQKTEEEVAKEKAEATRAVWVWMFGSMLGPLVVLFVGYILHLFM